MSKDDLRHAWDYCDNEHGFDDPCGDCEHLARGFAAARLAAIRELREWAHADARGKSCAHEFDKPCASCRLLARLDEMERG